MDVQTITMDPAEAREKLREYRTGLHRKADAEWQAAAAGYEALAKGTPLINVAEAIRGAPFDMKGRPQFAIARADERQVRFTFTGNGSQTWCTFDSRYQWGRRGRAPVNTPTALSFDLQRTPPAGKHSWECRGFALVPMVPPSAGRHDLSKHYVLWDVELWSDTPIGAQPPVDPFLLRHLGGDLYVIVAEWDLTKLERAVMGRRAHG